MPFDINNIDVQMVMVLKLQQLQRDELPTLTYEQLERYLMESLWVYRKPMALHEACQDVLHINASDVVVFLTKNAIIDGAKMDLSDFEDLIGG